MLFSHLFPIQGRLVLANEKKAKRTNGTNALFSAWETSTRSEGGVIAFVRAHWNMLANRDAAGCINMALTT